MFRLAGLVLVVAFAIAAAPAHDVAPAVDGGVWLTARAAGYLGWLDPATGEIRQVALGPHSAPHGVIVGPDGAARVTDGGQNAIVRVDPQTNEVRVVPLPGPGKNADLNTAAFDRSGVLWFTGQSGLYGRLDPATAELNVFDAPRGAGPYGIIATPDGSRVFSASLAGSHIAEINLETGEWSEWKLPGVRPSAYAVWVDAQDTVWLSDWGSNAIVRFDPATEAFQRLVMPLSGADIRVLQGRAGEVWGAESGQDRIVVIRH